MNSEDKNSKDCSKRKKFMLAYGFVQLGSNVISAIALVSIAFGLCSIKKESKVFNNCISEVIETGSTSAEAVSYCNGGKWLIHS